VTPHVFHLTLLGAIDLKGPDAKAAESVVVQPKHLALVAHLAVEAARVRSRRFSRRDHLVGLFWPELDQLHARTALRRVVYQLRAALGAEAIVSRGDEEIALEENIVRSDVLEFSEAVTKSQLARALELYCGELLPGFHLSGCGEFARWLDASRDHFRREAGASAWALAQRLEAEDELTMAGRKARQAVEFSWDDERMLRRALEMLGRLGDRSGALRLYDHFAQRMRSEYDAAPSPETTALADRLRAQ
jgi:DNA-binding SARP family transcriptional activator